MAELRERIAAELENIDSVLARLPTAESLPELSELELAGAAALVHSFYNGVENIIKQLVRSTGNNLPSGESWHKELLQIATEAGFLSEATSQSLWEYLAFRHFFTHSYAFDIDPDRLQPLIANLPTVEAAFRRDIGNAAM